MRERGFSLIEIIVVLVLVSLAVALLAPSFSQFSKSVELKAAAKKISAILRYCRSEAVNRGKVYRVFFDPDLKTVKVESMESTEAKENDERKAASAPVPTYFLPQGINMKEVKFDSPQYPSEFPAVEFYPSGGSNGGAILLDAQDMKGYKIKIHFLTGIVVIEKV